MAAGGVRRVVFGLGEQILAEKQQASFCLTWLLGVIVPRISSALGWIRTPLYRHLHIWPL